MNFADPGVWCWQVRNVDYNRLKRIADVGFRWVAIQIVSSDQGVQTGDYRDFIDSARAHSLDVAGFGWCLDKPLLEAEAADRLLDYWALDGFIANGEKPISYSQEGYACPECFGYSQTWVNRWKALRADFPLGFSSYCDFQRADIHYAPWIEAGAVAMPQTYANELPWAWPQVGVKGALDVKQPWNGPPMGWAIDKIHPTWANYPSGDRPIPTPQEYARDQFQTSARGFNVYLGEHIKEADWEQYEAVIPVLTATKKVPLTDEELPYTGPYYGPTSAKTPKMGPTVKALKRALHRMGIGSFANPDLRYNLKLEAAMHVFQKRVGIVPASGQYGLGAHREMKAALAPDGSYAMDAQARQWVKEDARS